MRLPEATLYPDQARLLVPPMLSFLQATHEFYMTHATSSFSSFTLPDYEQQFAMTMEAGRTEVNDCLVAMGGLMISFASNVNARKQRCVITEWRGYKDDDDDRLLTWGMAGTPARACISLSLDTVLDGWEPAPIFRKNLKSDRDITGFSNLDLKVNGIPPTIVSGSAEHGL